MCITAAGAVVASVRAVWLFLLVFGVILGGVRRSDVWGDVRWLVVGMLVMSFISRSLFWVPPFFPMNCTHDTSFLMIQTRQLLDMRTKEQTRVSWKPGMYMCMCLNGKSQEKHGNIYIHHPCTCTYTVESCSRVLRQKGGHYCERVNDTTRHVEVAE